jgi:ornithine carbamoyltransferase
MPRTAPQSTQAEQATVAERIAETTHVLLDAMTDAIAAPSDQSERVRHLAAAVADLAPLIEQIG